ncbi:MAG: glycosyltransferase family 2 protein [Bacteroidota bacterium]
MTDISVVVPLYNEEESLEELVAWISRVADENNFSYEVLLIDDGSTDSSWDVINKLATENQNIRGVRFNRNHGKSAALDAGFGLIKGDVVITLDADLQDSPDEIPALFKKIKEEGYDLVSGWKKKRHDPFIKNNTSKIYNGVSRILTGIKLHDMNCGLKAYKADVVKNIHIYGEMHRYIPVIAKWQGFTKIGEQVVIHQKRKYGKTKFGMERFIHGFLDLLTIIFVSKFRKRPMHFFGTLGVLSFLFGFLSASWIIWQKIDSIYFSQVPVQREVVDQPLFFLALVAIIIGVQLFLTGFIAELLARQSASKKEHLVVDTVGE